MFYFFPFNLLHVEVGILGLEKQLSWIVFFIIIDEEWIGQSPVLSAGRLIYLHLAAAFGFHIIPIILPALVNFLLSISKWLIYLSCFSDSLTVEEN